MIIVDTGVLVALINARDEHHTLCRDWFLATTESDLLIPSPLIAEACYMAALRGGPEAEAVFLHDLSEGRYGTIIEVSPQDLRRMSDLVNTYSDLPLGGADASIVAIAERLGIDEIATVDRRHFTVVRPAHTSTFRLLP